jgi:hypothetical protein
MLNKHKREAKYRLTLSTLLWEHREAVYEGLMSWPTDGLAAQLAEFLLAEARWDVPDFLRCYINGSLDD